MFSAGPCLGADEVNYDESKLPPSTARTADGAIVAGPMPLPPP